MSPKYSSKSFQFGNKRGSSTRKTPSEQIKIGGGSRVRTIYSQDKKENITAVTPSTQLKKGDCQTAKADRNATNLKEGSGVPT
jgi:hypothetical protein